MDKFSRTTEIDTAGVLNAIEQDTPKKSRKGNIIALVICIFVAIGIWAYVMYTDPEIHEKEFDNIQVTYEGDDYEIIAIEEVDVVIKGTNRDITSISKSDIKIVIVNKEIIGEGTYKVGFKCIVDGKSDGLEVIPSVNKVEVRVTKK